MADENATTGGTKGEIPKFNEMASCPKCGSLSIGSRYEKDEATGREIIRRTCQRCGYSWPEAPLDAQA